MQVPTDTEERRRHRPLGQGTELEGGNRHCTKTSLARKAQSESLV